MLKDQQTTGGIVNWIYDAKMKLMNAAHPVLYYIKKKYM